MFLWDKVRHGRGSSTVETCSGRYVDVRRPDPATIDTMDIAHALSMQCRFNGHVRDFYSVAEHCVRVANHLPPALRIHGLLHDAAEAYVGDVVTPVKRWLYGFAGMEDRTLRAIYAHLRVPRPGAAERKCVHQADLLALREEAWALLPSQGRWQQGLYPDGRAEAPASPAWAIPPHRGGCPRPTMLPAAWPVLCLPPAEARALWLASLDEVLSRLAGQRYAEAGSRAAQAA